MEENVRDWQKEQSQILAAATAELPTLDWPHSMVIVAHIVALDLIRELGCLVMLGMKVATDRTPVLASFHWRDYLDFWEGKRI